MRSYATLLLLAVCAFVSTNCHPIGPPDGGIDRTINWRAPSGPPLQPGSVPAERLLRQVNLKPDMVKAGTYGRKVVRPMHPLYITIHSTENYTAGAAQHALALKRGALRARKDPRFNRIGFLIWHFTVDDHVAIQHMPTNEQGEHADFNGPGNNYSIGIEMCENRGGNLNATIERTAKLTAYLMKRNGIPLRCVVPHEHWARRGVSPEHKNCPHFLMDHGHPGAKWRWFIGKVNYYYQSLQ